MADVVTSRPRIVIDDDPSTQGRNVSKVVRLFLKTDVMATADALENSSVPAEWLIVALTKLDHLSRRLDPDSGDVKIVRSDALKLVGILDRIWGAMSPDERQFYRQQRRDYRDELRPRVDAAKLRSSS